MWLPNNISKVANNENEFLVKPYGEKIVHQIWHGNSTWAAEQY